MTEGGQRAAPRHDGSGMERLPILSLAIASGAALAYEILLTRLFAIIHWHHFAYMIISLALLGYGLSGTVLALARAPLTRHYARSYPLCLGLFALALPVCFLLAQSVSLHPEELLWRPLLYWRLPLIYLLLAVPFLCVALAVSILLTRFHPRAGQVYAADLLGAGAGSILVILLLNLLLPQHALWVLAASAAAAALISLAELREWRSGVVAAAVLALLLPFLLPDHLLRLKVSPFKSLEQTLQVSGADLLETRASPLGLISVVGNPGIPFRHAPGLSLNSLAQVPDQLAVFTDAESLTVINAWSGGLEDTRWLDDSTSALPYHLIEAGRILVAEAGGGSGVLRALTLGSAGDGTPRIDALEPNAQLLRLVAEDYAGFAGDLYRQPGVRLHSQTLRGFLARAAPNYDLINLPTPGGPGGSSGLYALSETYSLTVEAFVTYLGHIDRRGFVVVTSWLQLPPRDALKLLATAVAALRTAGVADPSTRLLMIRGWQTATLLIKGSDITPPDVAATLAFCKARGFDPVFYPGMKAEEANRVNRLPRAAFHEAARALVSDQDKAFFRRYQFDIAPPSDDRPYFFRFFRWRALPEILRQRERGGMGMLEGGYVILLVALVQALAVTLLTVLLPLRFAIRRRAQSAATGHVRFVTYFALLGLAFMFLEIAFIQKFLLFLQHPVYSVTVVLASFLVFAGAGSASMARLVGRWGGHTLAGVVVLIALLGLVYLILLPFVQTPLASMALGLRVVLAIILLAPVAFLMGIPFPLGLARLGSLDSRAIPWAWAVNGCASVTGVIVATLIAMQWGFTALIALALAMYVLCATVAPTGAAENAPVSARDTSAETSQ